ncbi:MAG TPA: hypothetical protein VK085_13460 [Pseudogracilibacillus sp.]|nr:hypothetical protein [Pseudogracilibacillus sp.]
MKYQITFDQLAQKVKQQEDTIAQLVKIIASTNHRISELQVKQENLEQITLSK